MNDYDIARQLVQVILKLEQTPIPTEIIQEKVRAVITMLNTQRNFTVQVDEEKLVRELQTIFNTWIGKGTILDNQEEHSPWLFERKSEISWDFWERYRRYLEEDKGWAPATVNSLERLTDEILDHIEDPQRAGAWDRRGMVVGHVQSGKTANYTGLICKAVDAGYKLIIILAGLQNNLRSQTQLRLDEGFLGCDSQVTRAYEQGYFIGAGRLPTQKNLIAIPATNSSEQGDFNKRKVNQFGVPLGSNHSILFVVKKNKSVLESLITWALRQENKDKKSGKRLVKNLPLLMIDDEADNASINTNPPLVDENGNFEEELDVTTINGLIRRLLHSFEQSAYVGYTATPFANIFIYPDPEKKNPEYGDDLFPRSFIVNLPAPSNYVGPAQVFGLDADPTVGIEKTEGLPIIRLIKENDQQEWMPLTHKKDHIPGELPESLKKAIRAFILSCTVRLVRGQEREHNSMLVHVTRFTKVQELVTEQVQNELTWLQRRLRYSDGNAPRRLEQELKSLYLDDFLPTTESVSKSVADPEIQPVSWEEIKPLLNQAASRIHVKTINGSVGDVLDYDEYKKKGLSLNVIAIGGNKLSRGLTLEGLTVSYYLRASRMYDTLMQMGRWFGYRPGYLDLSRLYTTKELVECYEHITVASEELRQEFDYMAASLGTPEDFGLKVRTHPQGLMITQANKMRTGTTMRLSYARSLSETTIFYKDEKINQRNLEVTEELLRTLGKHSREEINNYIWERVPVKNILEFLLGYKFHEKCRIADTVLLTDYIKAQLPMNELVSWTVILISNNRGKKKNISEYEIGLTKRDNASPEPSQEYRLIKSRLLNPTDEWLDLPKKTRDEILELTRRKREETGKPPSKSNTPDGKIIREKRSSQNGLLLLYPLDPKVISSEIPVIGFVVSFPKSETAQSIEYTVNNTYWEEEFGDQL